MQDDDRSTDLVEDDKDSQLVNGVHDVSYGDVKRNLYVKSLSIHCMIHFLKIRLV